MLHVERESKRLLASFRPEEWREAFWVVRSGCCERLSGTATDKALILALRLAATPGETVLDAMDVATTCEVGAFLLASTAPSRVCRRVVRGVKPTLALASQSDGFIHGFHAI